MMKPLLWRLTVEPLKPKEQSEGGILMVQEAIDAQKVTTCVGKVIELGKLAFKAKPREGLDYATEDSQPAIGDFVLYGRHSGQRTQFRDGREVVVLNDTDVLCNIGADETSAREVKSYV